MGCRPLRLQARVRWQRVSLTRALGDTRAMPVNIYRVTPDEEENEEIAFLCDDQWLLWQQIEALSAWLDESGARLPPAEYVADVGFCWRRDAASGGPVIAAVTLRRMGEIGMSLYLSEYSGFADELTKQDAEPNVSPNGDPGERFGNSGVSKDPPSETDR